MSRLTRDLAKLRWHLVGAAASVAAAAAITYLAATGRQAAQSEHDAASSRYRQAQSRLSQVHGEEAEIREKAALFLRLQEKGIIGEEKRLEWSELLNDARHRLRIPTMDYEFAPQRVIDGNAKLAFHQSGMKLHLETLHEVDTLDFLDYLQEEAMALLWVRNCKLSRLPASAARQEAAPALISADCSIDWVTLQIHEGARP